MTLDSPAKKLIKLFVEKESSQSRFVVLLCEDSWRRSQSEESLAKSLFRGQNFSVSKYNASALTQQELVKLKDRLHEPSLFSPNSVVLLQDIDKVKSQILDQLKDLILKIPAASLLILSADKLPAKHSLKALAVRHGCLLEMSTPGSADFQRWVKSQLKNKGLLHYPPVLPELLEQISGGEFLSCLSHIERIALFAESDSITEGDLQQLLVNLPEAGEFPMIEALFAGNLLEAQRQLHHLLEQGKSPFVILSLLSRSLTQHLQLSECLKRKMTEEQISENIGMKPWLQKKLKQNLASLKADRLSDASARILLADSQLKNKSLGADYILEQLLHGLAK